MRFFILAVLGLAMPLKAETVVTVFNMKTGDQLKSECFSEPDAKHPETIVRKMSCVSYVTGIADLTEDLRVTRGYPKPFCLPRDLVSDQAVTVVKNWLAGRQPVGMPASHAVITALAENYPCN